MNDAAVYVSLNRVRLHDMKSHFQLDEDIVHLNHAAVAPWPLVTRDAVIAFANENAAIGSQRYDQWLQTEQQLKHKLQRLINAASSDEIALLKNTSEGLSLIAQGLSFQAGDNIVIPEEEFPSNKVVWQALASQGVELRCVSVQHNTDDPEQSLIDVMDDDTRLLSCSSVQYARGLRLDLTRLGTACRQNNTLFCVDAIQSLGALAFDAQACFADFVVADGHKWLCAPEGTALFYCREAVRDQLQLRQYGWHMLKDPFDFSQASTEIQIANSAQRFECGSPNMMGIAALDASLELLLSIGMDKVESDVIANATYLIEQLQVLPDTSILSPVTAGRYAGIVTFNQQSVDTTELYQYLQANDVICACRGGGIRFSPHFYTAHADIDRALHLLAEYTAE